ncbi:MAG TPA: type-F conjugative transfer system pilin assembly protein TrbC [Nitrosomonas mobilis]|jgi:conjugal transfer pilus assembly protein TrbC|nr:type-F conjugative transfer system pilin assembly protein TrbC [Nitrosomonas mobilis]
MRNNRFLFFVAVVATLVFLPSLPLAQEHLFPGNTSTEHKLLVRLPDDEDIRNASSRARKAMQQLDTLYKNNAIAIPQMPDMDALPQPAFPADDITTIAEKFRDIGKASAEKMHSLDLLILVSLSMPEAALRKLADQAEKAGATLLFRGLKDDSMMKMGEAVKAILDGRNVHVAIHPPAFQQFGVTRVPAFVLASQEAGKVMDNGCSKPQTFVKVSGDVSLDYALEYIERTSPDWSMVARSFHSRIVRGIQ